MQTELNRAKSHDRRTHDEDDHIIRPGVEGFQVSDTETESQHVLSKWLKCIWESFRGNVIRRTGHSQNNEGKLISGVLPPISSYMLVKLYASEINNLEKIAAQKVVEKGSCGNKLGISQVGSNPRVVFFLSFM
jgi:hypothetical protein